MNNTLEEIKNHLPGFMNSSATIAKILEETGSTEKQFNDAVRIEEMWILAGVSNMSIRTFLNLPVNTHFGSNMLRRSFLRATLLIALDQAIDNEKGNNCFAVSIKNATLEKAGFQFKTDAEIDEFGKKTQTFIPRLLISGHGKGTRDDETYFNVYYKYS